MSKKPMTIHQLMKETSFKDEERYIRLICEKLYKDSCDKTIVFTKLLNFVISKQNIMVAYKKLSQTSISYIKDCDRQNIVSISSLSVDDVVKTVRYILCDTIHGYRTKPVSLSFIEKMNGVMKPFSVGGIWDRLIQQCILQILGPICEAKFSDNSYGSRPIRSYEQALSKVYRLMQRSHLHYVIIIKFIDFYEHVNHAKLIRQIWALGIRDKRLICILKQILCNLSSNIKKQGISCSGILMPLFANINFNEFDHWIDSQWQAFPMIHYYTENIDRKSGMPNYGSAYRAMRKTTLKEMNLVRFNEDILVFCRTKDHANRALIAISKWFKKRLNVSIDLKLSCITNARKKKFEFLGFDIRLIVKGKRSDGTPKYVVKSNMSEYQYRKNLRIVQDYMYKIARPKKSSILYVIQSYNDFVTKLHLYFRFATNISVDCSKLQFIALRILYNRLKVKSVNSRSYRLEKHGRLLTETERKLYGTYKAMVYEKYTKEPIYPIGCISRVSPIAKRYKSSPYDMIK